MTPALEPVVAGAKSEGALTLQYGADSLGGADGAQIAALGIKRLFGVDLTVTFVPGPSFAPMAARLHTEMQARQRASTDVYYGTAVEIAPYVGSGLWRKVDWPALYPGRITPAIAEEGGLALRVVTALPGIQYNKTVGADFAGVTETADLLKPEFKGRLYTEPYLAGFDVLVSGEVWGFAKTAAFVAQLSKQVGGLIRCGQLDEMASGAAPALAITCGENNPKYQAVLPQHVLHDAAMRRFDYIAIPENAAHPNAAILFGLYLSTPEGQKTVALGLFGSDLDTYPDAATHRTTSALERQGVKFTDVTLGWWGRQKDIDANVRKLTRIIAEH